VSWQPLPLLRRAELRRAELQHSSIVERKQSDNVHVPVICQHLA
jgi:hypothetical protein